MMNMASRMRTANRIPCSYMSSMKNSSSIILPYSGIPHRIVNSGSGILPRYVYGLLNSLTFIKIDVKSRLLAGPSNMIFDF
jgi:hypothetical protein